MERHLQRFRKPAAFIRVVALSLLLGACGGGDGTNTNAPTQEVGFASLSWQAPSERVDGASLSMSEIAGYRIYYGLSSGNYDSVLSVDDPYTSTMLVDDLPVATYYFVMTTVDTNGLESSYSSEVAKIVQSRTRSFGLLVYVADSPAA